MTAAGQREYLRRAVVLVLLISGFAAIGRSGLVATGLVALAVALYVALPPVSRPRNAMVYDRLPAVILPDILGCLMVSVFVALPVWAAREDMERWGPIHPLAVMTLPMAAISLVIVIAAARNAAFWMLLRKNELEVATADHLQQIAFGEIVRVERYRRGLPKWVRALTPLLLAFGKFTAAGSLMLARDTTGVKLVLRQGGPVVIQREGLEKPYRKLLSALRARHLAGDAAGDDAEGDGETG